MPVVWGYYAQSRPVPLPSARPQSHFGIEFLYVVAGKLLIRITDEDHNLAAGDSPYFDSTVPRSCRSGSPRTIPILCPESEKSTSRTLPGMRRLGPVDAVSSALRALPVQAVPDKNAAAAMKNDRLSTWCAGCD